MPTTVDIGVLRVAITPDCSVSHKWTDTEEVAFHGDFENKVYMLATTGAVKLKLYALPRTVNHEPGRHRETARFEAKVRVDGLAGAPRALTMRCRYEWAI